MKKPNVIIGIILGVVFVIIGIIYATTNGASLPTFFPGYSAGYEHVHLKHALAAFILSAAGLVFAWFQSGKKKTSEGTQAPQ